MKKLYWIIGLVLVGCSGNPPEENIISIDDFMGETGEEVMTDTIQKDTSELINETAIGQFVFHQLELFDTTTSREYHPIDRFTFNTREKITFKGIQSVAYGKDAMVNPTAQLFYYTFSDTTKTKNALYNWLDCFGSDCDQVRPNIEVEDLKTPPAYALVYDTTIIVVNYRCEDENYNWLPFQDSLINRFGKNYNYQIKLGCGGPLKWN